ncbi:MAG TPA: SDR family NAD(P)-dependent oxidoreductase [bacterium]|jgi:3-oxoacyl-[acyl-carrier protein] reductase
MDLNGKNCLVTGGCRGIGKSIAISMADAGSNVAVIDNSSDDSTESIVSEIEKIGGRSRFYRADVRSYSDAEKIVKEIVDDFGSIDILVCNAGINRDGVVWKMTEEQWDEVIDVNLKGCFNYIRAVSPFLKDQNHGRIITITSINGLRGKFGQSNYAASKAGITGLTKSVAKELGKYNVTVNAIAPGMILTDFTKKLDDKWIEMAKNETVLGKLGTGQDVANLAVFLASDLAGHITGQVIPVDGGQYI